MIFAMHLQAGIEPLIIIGLMIASAIYQAISKRKQDAESWEEWNVPTQPPAPPRQPAPPALPSQPPVITRTISPQPVLQKMQRPAPTPPPIPHDHESHEGPDGELTKFEESQKAYARASNLQQRIEERMAEIDRQTEMHVPTAVSQRTRTEAAQRVLSSFRKPQTVRQAFLASFVLNPPKSLE